MKMLFTVLLLLVFCTFHTQAQTCDSTLWKHIYKTKRLVLLKECMAVTGIIQKRIKEPDGDWHILIKLDAGQDTLLNLKNKTLTNGCLVVEVICANRVIQPGVVKICKACSNCKTRIIVPKKGSHVKVTGSFVKDNKHGWNEIHPISALEVI